jgi:hypothetical protein
LSQKAIILCLHWRSLAAHPQHSTHLIGCNSGTGLDDLEWVGATFLGAVVAGEVAEGAVLDDLD